MSTLQDHISTSFPPIAAPSAHLLILGSMPGVLSLKAHQYYAHPRNAFWRIMGNLYAFNAELPYAQRVETLIAANIAVWDVLKSCKRAGSLDSAIESSSRVANDFTLFFQQHPNIKLVAFNGAEAEKSFNTMVVPRLKLDNSLKINQLDFKRLPSTSPAHTLSLANKTAAWREALLLT